MGDNSTCCLQLNSSFDSSEHSPAGTGTVRDDGVTLAFNVMTCVMSVLSLIGSSTIISLYLYLPRLRTDSRRLLIYLSICDFMVACGNIMGVIINVYGSNSTTPADGTTEWSPCPIQAAISSNFSIGSFFWTTAIAANIYVTIVRNSHVLVKRLSWLTHAICWGVPALVLIITVSFDRYGKNSSLTNTEVWWCWVRVSSSERYPDSLLPLFWQLFTGKFWEINSYFIVIVLYSLTRFKIRQHMMILAERKLFDATNRSVASQSASPDQTSDTSQILRRAHRKLLAIPLMFIISRMWGTVRFFITLFTSPGAATIGGYIAPLQGAGDSSQGFLNCLVFILTTQEVKTLIRLKLNCWRRSASSPMTERRRRTGSTDSSSCDGVEDDARSQNSVQY